MSKQEFIDRLRTALNGRISPSLVMDNVNYYEDYINTEMRKGRTESEVLQSLGDPRLIARTIIETNGKGDGNTYQNAGYQNADYQSSGYQESAYQNNSYRDTGYKNSGSSYQNGCQNGYKNAPKHKHLQLPGWVWAIIAILIVGVVISVVFSVLSFLAPIIIPIVVVMFLVKLFRDWLN